jgi:hypothetical protein
VISIVSQVKSPSAIVHVTTDFAGMRMPSNILNPAGSSWTTHRSRVAASFWSKYRNAPKDTGSPSGEKRKIASACKLPAVIVPVAVTESISSRWM